MLMDGGSSVIEQQENKEKKKMEKVNKIDKIDALGGFCVGIAVSAAIVALAAFFFGLKTKKEIEKDMVTRGYAFYACNEKTGEVKCEYYKLEDVDVITEKVYNEKNEKNEKKGK